MATLSLKRPAAIALTPARLALRDAIADLQAMDASLVTLRTEDEAKTGVFYDAMNAVDAVEAEIQIACPPPVIRMRMTGLGPVYGDTPEPPPELSAKLAEARERLSHAKDARDLVRKQLQLLELDRPDMEKAVDQAARHVVATSPEALALTPRLAALQVAMYDDGAAHHWMVAEKLVSVAPVATSRWSQEQPLAGVVSDRLGAAPNHWPLYNEAPGARPWIDFLTALHTDPEAPAPTAPAAAR
jgi:hypothetical protein